MNHLNSNKVGSTAKSWRIVCLLLLVPLKNTLMLVKLNLLFPPLARKERPAKKAVLTKKQWVNADRIVMLLLFLSVIIAAVVFS